MVYFGVDGPLPGLDGAGAAVSAVSVVSVEEVRAAPLREVGPLLSDRDAGLMTHAVALGNFHDTHHFCPHCGEPSCPGVLRARAALHGRGHRRVPPQ